MLPRADEGWIFTVGYRAYMHLSDSATDCKLDCEEVGARVVHFDRGQVVVVLQTFL